MIIIECKALPNGAHRNQTFLGEMPEGWALIPHGVALPNFPFGNPIISEDNGVPTVTEWIPGIVPESGTIEPTPAQLREQAYNTLAAIEWDGSTLTVTEAAQLWQYYAAEGSEKAAQLQELIAAAKQTIRARFPDGEVPA